MERNKKIILLSILGLVIVSLSYIFYVSYSENKIASTNQEQKGDDFLSFSLQKRKLSQTNEGVIGSKEKKHDLDSNLIQETYTLESGQLIVVENLKTVWQSPDDWWIDDFVLNDSNNDGIIDINLSVWKPGNFGSSKPFWVEENDMSIKNHFFIFDFVDGKIKPIWQSSNLAVPNCEFTFADIDDDGNNDLIVIEGDYLQTFECIGNYVAVWKWNGWGFSNEERGEKGNYTNLKIEEIDGKNLIFFDSF